jgi:predicted nucleic acid-binding protein
VSQEAKLVVDASVAVKWYVPEIGSTQASMLLQSAARLVAPDLLIAEFGNILWKKVRRDELTAEEAHDIVDAFVTVPPVVIRPSTSLLRGALEIANGLQRPVYDALYLALAVAENCTLVTADDALVRAIRRTVLQRFIQSLGSN